MIDLMAVKLPDGGSAVLLTATIGGAHSDVHNKARTIAYTDCFSEGISIDMPIEEFYSLWMTCLVTEYEVVEEVEIEVELEEPEGALH